ncbi:MAG: TolC family protein [Kiritimatiellae bacterium]|nr:TolC family protein [Kiritimatiellia bacterium]
MMNLKAKTLAAMAAAALAGCGTIRSAREAQQAVESVGSGEVAGCEQISLAGATLPELVVFAVTNRPSMTSAALAVKDARLAMKEIAADAPLASSTPWNAAGLSASLGYSESSRSAHFSDLKAKTRRGSASGALSMDLLVWDFGRNAARAKAQAENVLAAECSLFSEGFTVFGEVASAYFALAESEALREVAATNLSQYASHLARAEDLFNAGEAQKLDVLKARLDLANASESLVSASNAVTVAGANLMAALGIDASQGDYLSVLGERVTDFGEANPWFESTTTDAAEEFDFARVNAPSMQAARARLRAASAQVDYAIADLKPSVSASLSLNWTDPLWYWRWGVSSVQSIFTGFRKTTAVDRAVVAMESARSTVEAAEKTLSRQIEVAIAERDNAREALRTASESLQRARENMETVASQYEVGDVSRVEFSDAVAALTDALAGKVRAFCRGQAAEAALFALVGRDPEYVR